MKDTRSMMQRVVDALIEVPGLQVQMEHDGYDLHGALGADQLHGGLDGPDSQRGIRRHGFGAEPIYLSDLGDPDDLTVVPTNLDDAEVERVIAKLREVLMGGRG